MIPIINIFLAIVGNYGSYIQQLKSEIRPRRCEMFPRNVKLLNLLFRFEKITSPSTETYFRILIFHANGTLLVLSPLSTYCEVMGGCTYVNFFSK